MKEPMGGGGGGGWGVGGYFLASEIPRHLSLLTKLEVGGAVGGHRKGSMSRISARKKKKGKREIVAYWENCQYGPRGN